MAFFEWRDEYSVGVTQSDEQHRKLVGLLNKLYEAMQQGKGPETIGGVLSDLVEYTKSHFRSEETLMQLHQYPEIEAHKKKHAAITVRVLEFQSQMGHGGSKVVLELSNYLKGWLQKHICETDKLYGPFLNSRGVH